MQQCGTNRNEFGNRVTILDTGLPSEGVSMTFNAIQICFLLLIVASKVGSFSIHSGNSRPRSHVHTTDSSNNWSPDTTVGAQALGDLSYQYEKVAESSNTDAHHNTVFNNYDDQNPWLATGSQKKRSVSETKNTFNTKGSVSLGNDTAADNHTTTTHEEETEHEHHKMHVAGWNFDHVKNPFIISAFLIAAGIAKLGWYFMKLFR